MKKPNIINWIILVLLVALVAMAAIKWFGPKAPPTVLTQPGQGTYTGASFNPRSDIKSQSFSSAEELNSFISSNSGSNYYGRMGGVMMDSAVAGGAEMIKTVGESIAPSAAPNTGEGTNDYSQTNNQVANVDEADLIKTDGNYIYTVSGNTVFIIKAYPGEEAETVSTIVLKNMNPSNLFIQDGYVAVFGNFYDNDYFSKMDIRPRSGMTFFNIYDVSDKAEPSLVKEYKFEGGYMDARMKDGYVYFVTQTWPEARPMPMPYMIDGATVKQMPVENIHYFNIPYDYPSLVSVYALNLNSPDEEPNSESILVEGGQSIYMSEDNIYLTYTEYINEYQLRIDITKEILADKLTETDKALIEKIKATDNDVLSQYEKESKIMAVYYEYLNYLPSEEQDALNEEIETELEKTLKTYEHLEYTVINKLQVEGMNIVVGGSGKVPGHIMNQFSMDEENDVFRIATTLSARWSYSYKGESTSTKSTNGVYTLDADLNQIGKLEGLAEDETIYSTRFIGDRLYMVTFKQVDPFFVIDLSDPSNPTELGKLKIPGFSRYLHPYDENIIIGIGNEATESGRVQGLKISLFDVSDVENPKELAKFVTDEKYATSTALYEHKAFLFSKDKNLLVIPAYSYNYDYSGGGTGEDYNGAFVFKITEEEITLRGLIDHSQGNEGYYYGAQVERCLYINELLYTKSMGLLRINKLEDLGSVKNISLKQGSTTDIPVY